MAPSEIDFYKVLGITRHATEDEIKKAFRKAAKDTHPDKNPGDPLAKEKFQDLQRAHDALKDNLERAKYDEDNPYHGYPEGTFPQHSKTKSSGTAKRYTTAAQPQPQWASSSSSTFSARGFAHQSGARPSAYKATYGGHPEASYRKSRSAYDHSGAYRSAAGHDDGYTFYEPRYRPESPRDYDRSSSSRTGPRQSTATPNGGAKTASSSEPRARPNSTPDPPQTDPAAPTPDYDLAAYIKERRAREAAAEAAQAEQKRQREEEEAIRARRAEMEEHKKKAEKLRKDEERQSKERERVRAEKEARRAEEEESKLRRPWSDINGHHSRNGYSQADPPFVNPFPYAEEDLEKKVAEELRAKSAASSTSRQRSKKSPTKPRHQRSHESDTNGYADGWGKPGNNGGGSGGFAYPFPKGEDVNEGFIEKMRRAGKGGVATEKQRETSSEQWENPPRETGSRTHTRTKSDPRPPGRQGSFTQPETARTSSPPSPCAEPESQSPRIASPRPRRTDSRFRFEFEPALDGPARKDSYHTPGAAAMPTGQESSFSKDPDIRFFDKPQIDPFNYTTAEELFPPKQAAARPQSQPVYPTQPQHAPAPRQTPQPHTQQQHQARQQPDDPPFKADLWDTLVNTTKAFAFPTTALRSPKKKMSGSSISKGKDKGREPTLTPDPINLPTHNFTNTKYGQCPIDTTDPIKPEPMQNSKSQTSHQTTVEDDVDAMDTAPDTGIPSPTASARPQLPKLGIGRPSVDSNSASPRSPLPGQLGGLDNLGKFMSVPPFKHANVGLENFEEIKSNLPLPSQTSIQPRQGPTPTLKGRFPKAPKPDIRDLYEPQTPAEEPFAVPLPPKIPKTPRTVTLESYNTLFYLVEPYIMKWNEYEGKYNDLHTRLSGSGLHHVITLDGNTIMNYITRVREKDMILENSYRQAREKHMQALEGWVDYRNAILELKQG